METVEDILASIEQAGGDDTRPEGLFARRDIVSAGYSETVADSRLRLLHRQGKIEYAGRFPRRTVTGSLAQVPHYKAVQK